jgi:hypothetical protein
MSFFHRKPVEIKLVGPNLVAAFHRAQPPLIWRFDLERNHSFTVALQGDEGDWELGITSAKGDFYPIVHFAAREDAEDALESVQTLLMKKGRSKFWGICKNFVLLLVVAALLFFGGVHLMTRLNPSLASLVSPLTPATTSLAPAPTPPGPGALPSGIPVPADDVLTTPR